MFIYCIHITSTQRIQYKLTYPLVHDFVAVADEGLGLLGQLGEDPISLKAK
jgi:hypothetical protein